MAKYINTRSVIDPETGEIVNEKSWIGYDGFSERGYKYRPRSLFIRYYFDSLPGNFDQETLMLLFMIAELMNEENVLVYKVDRKSKFSTIIYKPLSKEDIRERTRFKYGINKFDKCWRELCKHVLKRIQYHEYIAWAVNPSVISKCREIPFWLYDEFKDTINPHLSAMAIKKMQQKLSNFYDYNNFE